MSPYVICPHCKKKRSIHRKSTQYTICILCNSGVCSKCRKYMLCPKCLKKIPNNLHEELRRRYLVILGGWIIFFIFYFVGFILVATNKKIDNFFTLLYGLSLPFVFMTILYIFDKNHKKWIHEHIP